MAQIRPMNSALMGGNPFRRVITATPEQKAEALAHTREGATKIRDLIRELDLPASSFDAVLMLYQSQEWGVVQKAEDERETKEETDRANLIKLLREKKIGNPLYRPEIGGYQPMGRFDDGLEMASHHELVDLAKLHGIA